jgi:RNA polymerase sigma-70 factor (TIGR02960 family)
VERDSLADATLARARAGDEDAFRELTEPHRRELQVHCYRILGSTQDAEDLVQETLLSAWRGLEAFEGRASVRAWLYRIATNRCLDALRARSRRPREVQAMTEPPDPTRRTEPIWVEPYPDVLLEDLPDRSPGSAARYEARESIELAFVVALQRLPPRQRAALVLQDVLGFRTAEVAEMLDTGEGSVKGALQRARAALDARLSAADRERAARPNSARERQLVGRFADAVECGDVDEMVALLTDDAWVTMPPQGAPLRVVPTRANTQPAFGCYLPEPQTAIAHAYGLMVLTLEGDRISAITWFGDNSVFPHFGLPRTLRASG